ncbi:MAG TPA: tetratricopeptide repeat protein [Caulobacteraceae bacterium]|nr:tetratricopeptide repeat protein [Caulobacteraceae bacterium]
MTALCIVALCAGPVAVGAPASVQPALDIHVGQADAFSRIEFHWAGAARMDVKRAGQLLTLSFSRDAKPDIATLKSVPMKWVKSVDVRHEHGRIVFAITLTDDADAATGNADGADFVNVFAKAAPPPAPPSPQTPPPTRPDPVPQGGVVQMKVTQDGGQLKLDFPWRNPLGAAVFRRGDAIWIVFDAAAKIDLTQAPKNVTQFSSMQALSGPGYSAIRIATRSPVPFEVANLGSDWTVILEPTAQVPFVPVKLTRDDSAGPAALTAALSGATGVYWVDDPVVGDKVAVVTAQAPAKGIPIPHDFVQFTVLQSAQGMAVSSNADDLAVTFSGDIVTISRPKGLALSPTTNPQDMASSVNAPKPAAMPGLIGDDWSATGGAGYLARYDALVMPVADEEEKGAEGPTEGHMALARYLIGQGLAFEAIGVLNDAFRTHPTLGGEAEFRALRGMARAMAGRYKEAETDLAAPVLDDNPAANLWRGYVLAKTSQWADAKTAFSAGRPALTAFPAYWKQRFGRAAALTGLALNDVPGARSWIDFALGNPIGPDEDAQNQLVDAEVDQAEGDSGNALRKYQQLAGLPQDQVAGPAELRATQMQLASNAITPSQAIDIYDGLRYRWRGDAFELDTVRALGQLYLSQGRYREALEAFRSAGKDLPDLPETAQLQADLTNAFKTLFLEGQADGLQPIQALALFYDFKELTPVGADGDAMVRRLTRRLVDVDLLPQAEELLKYQVDNRLEGVPKAQVATDLAVIDLMDRKPEDALDAINGSRTTVLPQPLNLQRRIVAARALTGLSQYDTALEMLGSDTSADATDARAEIVWDQKAWPQAGAIFEKQLGDRYKDPRPLTEIQEGQLLRAAVAYSLAGDDASLTRLRQRFTPFIDGARDPAALRVALAGLNGGDVAPSDFSRISADNQLFAGWVAQMKSRFDQAPLPAPRSPQVARQAAADAPGPGKG